MTEPRRPKPRPGRAVAPRLAVDEPPGTVAGWAELDPTGVASKVVRLARRAPMFAFVEQRIAAPAEARLLQIALTRARVLLGPEDLATPTVFATDRLACILEESLDQTPASPGDDKLRNASSVGRMAGVVLPEHTPIYVGNLVRLGLARPGPEEPSLKQEYELVLTEGYVVSARSVADELRRSPPKAGGQAHAARHRVRPRALGRLSTTDALRAAAARERDTVSWFDLTEPMWVYVSIPIAAAIVGYATKIVMIWMMFNPAELKGAAEPYLGWQGQIPRRAAKMAAISVDTSQNNLLDPAELIDRIDVDELIAKILREVKRSVDRQAGISRPLIKLAVGGRKYQAMKVPVAEMVTETMPEYTAVLEDYAARKLDIEELIVDKLQQMTDEQYDGTLRPTFKDDEWIVVVLGAMLGFVVGELQLHLLLG